MSRNNFLVFILLSLALMTSVFAQQEVLKNKPVLKAGDTAPDFTLTDQNGNAISLSNSVKKSNVVLVFYRGYW